MSRTFGVALEHNAEASSSIYEERRAIFVQFCMSDYYINGQKVQTYIQVIASASSCA